MACWVKERNIKNYSIRLVDVDRSVQLFQQEVFYNMVYERSEASRSFHHFPCHKVRCPADFPAHSLIPYDC